MLAIASPQDSSAVRSGLYFRFPLSLRVVGEMLAARDIAVTYETTRRWGLKFGRKFANRIRRRSPRRGDNGTWTEWSSLSLARSTGSGVGTVNLLLLKLRKTQ
jgi:transposase-like protein